MDPYETTADLRPRKRSLLERCMDRLPFGLSFVNPWAPTPKMWVYPQSLSPEQALQLQAEEKNVSTPETGAVQVVVTIHDYRLARKRTVLDMKHDNRRLRHERTRRSLRSHLRRMYY